MPSLVIENVPRSLFDQIQRLATARKRTASDTALEVLETAFGAATPTSSEASLPQDPLLSKEICAPCDIPRPKGEPVLAVWATAPLPMEIYLTEEICAPFTLPRPKGERVVPIDVSDYIPTPHDLPDAE